MLSTRDLMAIRDPINNTPSIPAYNMKYGRRRRKRNKTSGGHVYKMATKLGVKKSVKGKPKSVSSLWNGIYTRGKSLLKKKEKSTKLTYLKKHIQTMRKKLGIKKGKKTPLMLWNNINTKVKQQIKLHHNKFGRRKKRRRRVVLRRGPGGPMPFFRRGPPRVRRMKLKRKKRSRFGSWWDNTQPTYSPVCASQQCADVSSMGGRYPFYRKPGSTWVPYYSPTQ